MLMNNFKCWCRQDPVHSQVPRSQAIPGVSFISMRNGARRSLRASSGGTHPAVIWQSHLLDVSPQQWNTLKVSYMPSGEHTCKKA